MTTEDERWALTSPDRQGLDAGTVVELFEIDAGPAGGSLHRFVPGRWGGSAVAYGGNAYEPTPIEVTGVSRGLDGPPARPRLRVTRLDSTIVNALVGTDGWSGARVTRTRVLEKHLDGRPQADPERHWPPERWIVDRLESETAAEMVWALASPLALDKRKLPGRQILRDVCPWRYRRWDAARNDGDGGWNYDDDVVECPYTGDGYWNEMDEPVREAAKDKCSRRLSGCRLRFDDNDLPYGGFVGISRVRTK